LRKDLEDNFDLPNCEPPTCGRCGQFGCICVPEEDDTIYCYEPSEEEPEEPEEEYDD